MDSVIQKLDSSKVETAYIYGKPGLFYGLKVDGTERVSYAYDSLGRLNKRTLKLGSGNTFETSYACLNSTVPGQTSTTIQSVTNGEQKLSYTYDKLGNIETIYKNGIEKVSYQYDSWGRQISMDDNTPSNVNAGTRNPFRYREYYFDAETGLYYLNTRYYDPETGRFINADSPALLLEGQTGLSDKNLYAYCDNNPIMRTDDVGEFWNLAAGAVIGAAISMATQAVDNLVSGKKVTDGMLTAAIGGAITGAVAASGIPVGGQAIVSGLVGAGSDFVSQVKEKGIKNLSKINVKQVALSGIIGAASGAYGGHGVRHKKVMFLNIKKFIIML